MPAKTSRSLIAVTLVIIACAVAAGTAIVLLLNSPPQEATIPKVTNVGPLGSWRMTLVNATSEYGVYTGPKYDRPGIPKVNSGDPVLTIKATLRNDYSLEHPVPDSSDSNNTKYAVFIVTATLFDKNGKQIQAPDVTDPYWMPVRMPQHGLDYGATSTFDIVLLTSRRDLNHYEIEIVTVASMPIP